jgi:hypothetical protein
VFFSGCDVRRVRRVSGEVNNRVYFNLFECKTDEILRSIGGNKLLLNAFRIILFDRSPDNPLADGLVHDVLEVRDLRHNLYIILKLIGTAHTAKHSFRFWGYQNFQA